MRTRRASNAAAKLEPALDAGVALELLQAYFLIHDDWMDRDTMRRGGPAVQAMLGKVYRSQRKGDAAAILAGDYAAALALKVLSRVDARPSWLPRILSCFAEMQSAAIAGRQLDIIGRTCEAAGGTLALTLIVGLAVGINALTLLFVGSAVVTLERFARVARRWRSWLGFSVVWALLVGAMSLGMSDPEATAELGRMRQWLYASAGCAAAR